MRKLFVFIAVTVASLAAALGLVVTSAAPSSHATKVGSPNFVCVAAWNLGICIGPPTKHG